MARMHARQWVVALGALPIEMGWCVGESLLVPYLLTQGVSFSVASLVWLVNPVFGSYLQAPCGRMSDTCPSRFGRRKPFLALFACTSLLGMALLVASQRVGGLTGSSAVGIGTAFFSFGVMDVSHDLLLTPTRALLNDGASGAGKHRLQVMNALYTLFGLLGRCAGFVVATWLPEGALRPLADSHFFASLCVSAAVLCTVATAILYCARDPSLGSLRTYNAINSRDVSDRDGPDSGQDDSDRSRYGRFEEEEDRHSAGVSFRNLPSDYIALWCVQFGGWLVINNFCFFYSSFFALCVEKAQPNASDPAFSRAVRLATLGFVVQAGISIVVTLLLPTLNRALGTRAVLYGGNCIGALAMALTLVLRTTESALVLLAVAGVMYPVQVANPFVLLETLPTTRGQSQAHRAQLSGHMNLSMVFAQIVVALSAFVQNMAARRNHGMSCATVGGMGAAVLGATLALLAFFRVPPEESSLPEAKFAALRESGTDSR